MTGSPFISFGMHINIENVIIIGVNFSFSSGNTSQSIVCVSDIPLTYISFGIYYNVFHSIVKTRRQLSGNLEHEVKGDQELPDIQGKPDEEGSFFSQIMSSFHFYYIRTTTRGFWTEYSCFILSKYTS